MHIQTVIEELGYRPQEAKVYLAALMLGESTVTDLAKRVKFPRTTVQAIAEDLHRKGLLNSYPKKRRMYWVAENPQKLLIRLEEREAALKSVMPELHGMRYHHETRPAIRLYRGYEEIKTIFDDIIETKHHMLGIIAWDEWNEFYGEEFLNDFVVRRVRHFLKIRLLTPRTKTSLKLKAADASVLRRTRYTPPTVAFNNTNFIYGNKVAIISLHKKQPIGIIIEDADVAHTMTILFDALWAQSAES